MPIARPRAVAAPALLAALVLSLAVSLLVPGGPVAAQAPPTVVGASDGPDAYFPEDGNGGYQVTHYRIHDRYRPGTDELVGRTTLTAVAGEDNLSSFHLDLRLTPDEVTVDGQPATFSKPTKHELRVTPATPVAAGSTFRVSVLFHGFPTKVGTGTFWEAFFRSGGETAAVGEPQIGPQWFAGNETPGDKATYDITIRVPRGQQAVSNGHLVSRTVTQHWTAWRWRINEPISTYLAFFVAGRFENRRDHVDGRSLVYSVSRQLAKAQRERAFDLLTTTPRVLRWAEQRFGRYPYADAGGVMSSVPTGFALENASRPFYSWYGGPGTIGLIVHELAHQWFGDTIALEQWRDTWLNEGFATYVEWLWEESHGRSTVDELLHATYSSEGAGSSFWDLEVSDPGPEHIFDTEVYQRGAMMLAALRCRVGAAQMGDLLRAWLVAHRDSTGTGTGTGEQFRALAAAETGEDLTAFFQHWLDDTAKPAATAANGLGCA